MKLRIALSVSFIFSAAVFLTAEPEPVKSVKSNVEEASVFFNGAELVHAAKAQLVKGSSELRIEGLSPKLDRNSIKVKTTNGVMVSSFEFSVDYLAGENLGQQVKKLQSELEEQQKQLDEVSAAIKINNNMLALLKKAADKKAEGTEKSSISIDELGKTIDYYGAKSAELERTIRTYKEREIKLRESVQNLTHQLEQEKTRNSKTSASLKLSLSSPAANECLFTVTYYTSAASWSPFYDINVASTDKPVQIVSKAKVRQTSGIEWDKVKLTLTTSSPSAGKTAPLFNAWFLRQIEHILQKKSKEAIQNSYTYADESDALVEYEKAEKAEDDVSIRPIETQLNLTYNIALPYSIPGNGKEQNIDLGTQNVPASFKYYCVPKLDYETYVLAEISNWEKLNLLNGAANITYDGTYMGETYIQTSSTQEKLSLTLGTDKRIVVKREQLKDYSSGELFGGGETREFVYELTVRNNQNKPVKMVLKDQYPLSTSKEISVELLKDTTKPTVNKEDIGVITWEYELKPGETKIFKTAYRVKYPKGSNLNWQ